MDWSWTAWSVSVAAVVVSALVAWRDGHWARSGTVGLGFVNHGGMWGDLILLPFANAVIVPHLSWGSWLPIAIAISIVTSLLVHRHWYAAGAQGADGDASDASAGEVDAPTASLAGEDPAQEPMNEDDDESEDEHVDEDQTWSAVHAGGDHMWPARTHGTWARDLSPAGWAHVAYVAGELSVLIGFLLHDIPRDAVLLVAAVFTVHLPLGLLQPRYAMTGHIATMSEQPLLLPALLAVWAVTALKL